MEAESLAHLQNAVNSPTKQRDFGGLDHGDDRAALLNAGYKPLTQIVQDDSFREFEFRQYLFACQSKVCNGWKRFLPTFCCRWTKHFSQTY